MVSPKMILAHTIIPVLKAFAWVALIDLGALIWMLTVPRPNRRVVLAWGLVAYVAVTALLFYMSLWRLEEYWFKASFYGGLFAASVFVILGCVGRARRNGC